MSVFREPGVPSRPAWEYKVLSIPIHRLYTAEAMLNELGTQGWELVSGVPGDSKAIVFTLKRLRD